jgi:hypothetical protein
LSRIIDHAILSHIKQFEKLSLTKINQRRNMDRNDQNQTKDNSSMYPGIDLAFTLTKELIDNQLKNVDILDSKANFALAGATGVVSAAIIFQPSLFAIHPNSVCSALIPGFIHTLPLLLRRALPLTSLIITYLVVMVFFFFAYKTRNFQVFPKPRKYLNNLHHIEQDAKILMYPTMVEIYEQNKKELEWKARWINGVLLALGVETIILGLLLLYHVAC